MPSAALLGRPGTAVGADTDTADATPAVFEDSPAEESPRLVHRVKAGETLSSIARKYQTTVENLRQVNNLRTSTLKVGARLIVQAAAAVATATAVVDRIGRSAGTAAPPAGCTSQVLRLPDARRSFALSPAITTT